MSSPTSPLTIVALGASAGGLEALQGFFAAMPADARFAFVVITHLPPQRVSQMAEILGRATPLPVTEAQDREQVLAAHVYVIPPNRLISIHDGLLRLQPATPRPAIPHPIDYFMRALAEDQQERCVGIVLSGTDHDGTAGLKEIRAAGGLALVQDPDSAQFPGMPRSAIEAAAADAVLSVEQMGRVLVDYLEHAPEALPATDPADTPDPATTDAARSAASMPATSLQDRCLAAHLNDILTLVHERSGQDFRWYRPAMLLRRLRRRMGLQSMADGAAYQALLQQSDNELRALVKDFLISVTEFFRQPEAWKTLENEVLPRLFEARAAAGEGLRVWTPGCATGEESYSIAMLLLEQRSRVNSKLPLTVLASDVDIEALRVARAGAYPESIVDQVGAARITQFFETQGNRYVVRRELREVMLFALQDIVRNPPFSKLDLIICRNLLIYFEPAQQARILDVFHFALNPGGILFLGPSESLGSQSELFEPISRTHRIFRRVGSATKASRIFDGRWNGPGGFLTPAAQLYPGVTQDPAGLLRRQLGGRTHHAAVLVNRELRTLYVQGEHARFLQPMGESAGDLLSLLRDGMRLHVQAGLQRAILSAQVVELDAQVADKGPPITVRVRIEPLSDFAQGGMLLVLFNQTNQRTAQSTATGETMDPSPLEAELERLRSELVAAQRESETSNAELRVAHEEAMSLNEELQSSNEELQTSKEELQSMNEELTSVNSELQQKVDELDRALGDLRNFMDSTRVATVFLDRALRIRRFTQDARRLFHLIDSDGGRPLHDIVSTAIDPDLLTEAAAVLVELAPREKEVVTLDGEWFLRRILPYRTQDERIEGVVITYTEITALRDAAQDARRLATVLRDSNDAVIVHDFDGRILFWNYGAEQVYGYTQQAALGSNISRLEPESERGAALLLAAQLRQGASLGAVMARRLTAGGHLLDVSVTISALRDDTGTPYAWVTTERNVTERLHQESELRFRSMVDDIPMLIRIEDTAGQARFLNHAWLTYTGETASEALLANGWFKYIHPDDLPEYLRGMRCARATWARFECDLRLRHHDGSYRWMRTTAVARSSDGEASRGYVSVSTDIEERKRAEQAVAREGRRKDEFLAMLAHELRNPLFPIANAVSVVESTQPSDPKIVWASQVIGRQAQQLARLVDDLMDVARIASGKVVLKKEPIDMQALTSRAHDLSQPLIDARQQRLAVALPPDPIYVEGDVVRLTQVLGNLLNNASKYSEPGSEIRMTVTASPQEVAISVIDRGAGISPDMLPRVFDLFSQEDKTLDRAQGGLGIGLNLVERLVRAHGGSVEARSAGRGSGSEFIVRLPRLLQQTRAPAAAAIHQANLGSRRVLVVDDNLDGATTVAMLLELVGHTVRMAKDGSEALNIAREFHPQVVLLDIGLPGMSGYDVARALRGRRETANALLVAVTGYGQAEDVEHAKAAGFDHHLVKPVLPANLLELINQHLVS